MNDYGDLTPPTAPDAPNGGPGGGGAVPPIEFTGGGIPASPVPSSSATSASWWPRYRRFLIPAGAVAALAVASAATLLVLLKPAPTVERMVPATDNMLVIANVDPSATQKLNLLRALHSFPSLSTDNAITDQLDKALKDTGLTFSGDIQPWLGAEVGVSGQISLAKSSDITGAAYFVSRDDARAGAMLSKLRAGKIGSQLTWQEQSYSGITISVGTPRTAAGKPAAYAYVDHVVVIASSAAEIRAIIDADQGRAARLVDSANYKATIASLPADRLAVFYLDGKSLVADIKKQLATVSTLSTGAPANLADLDAFEGVGAALSANSDGLLADMVLKLDQSKLSASSRNAMAHQGSAAAVLHWIPRGSDAFFALGNLNQTLKTLMSQAGRDPSLTSAADQVGLTAVIPHLTGGAALELEVGARVIPAGALLLGTNDAPTMRAFLGRVVVLATQVSAQSSVLTPTPAKPSASIKTTTYRGVLITSYATGATAGLGTAFEPSFAVTDGMGVLASNVAEVKAVIDAHTAGSTIAGDPSYQTALHGALSQPGGVLYLNVGSLLQAAHRFSAESGLSSVDTQAVADLAPVKSVILTVSSRADAIIERLFVVIG